MIETRRGHARDDCTAFDILFRHSIPTGAARHAANHRPSRCRGADDRRGVHLGKEDFAVSNAPCCATGLLADPHLWQEHLRSTTSSWPPVRCPCPSPPFASCSTGSTTPQRPT